MAADSSVNVTYEYDPLGRRARKSGTGVATTEYLTDGMEMIAEYNGAGTMLRRYVYGAGVDERIAMVTVSGGAITYYHADHQGSTVALTNASGAVTDGPFTYSAYGEIGQEGPTGNPYRYTGRYLDTETGLYYYRARYYSPTLGRFLQTDPIGIEDQINLYAYVGNDPVNATDPSGLCGTKIKDKDGESKETSRCVVNIVKPYKRPKTNPRAKVNPVTESEARKQYDESSYEEAEVSEEDKKAAQEVIGDKAFKGQASQIIRDSKNAVVPRELGALAVYENEDGEYDVYSVGVPNPEIATRMRLELPENAGKLLIIWHPHPYGDKPPSPRDLRNAAVHDAIGIIRYDIRPRSITIFRGQRKPEE